MIRNQYIGVNGGNFWPGAVAQSDVTVSFENVSVILWHSTGLGSDSAGLWDDFDDEFDVLGIWGSKHFSLGVGYFKIVRAAADLDGDAFTVFGSAEYLLEFGGTAISPFIQLEAYAPTAGVTPGSGEMVRAGVKTSGSWKSLSTFVQVNALYDTGAFDFDSGTHVQGRLEVSWPLSDKLSVVGDMLTSVPISKVNDGRKTFVQAGIGLTVSL